MDAEFKDVFHLCCDNALRAFYYYYVALLIESNVNYILSIAFVERISSSTSKTFELCFVGIRLLID